jgi:hypothetical protein
MEVTKPSAMVTRNLPSRQALTRVSSSVATYPVPKLLMKNDSESNNSDHVADERPNNVEKGVLAISHRKLVKVKSAF